MSRTILKPAALLVAALTPALSCLALTEEDQRQALHVSQSAIGNRVGAHEFTDRDGRPFNLQSLRGRPAVISLIYTSCHNTCPTITKRLQHAAGVARDALGRDAFNVVTVGFDVPNDTPERMRAYAKERGVADSGWRFLSGDAAGVRALTDELGFIYNRIGGGFDHLAQISILDGEGRVYRQVYGADFEPPALVEPLRQLAQGRAERAGGIGALIEQVRLFCTVYDPNSGTYRFDYSLIVVFATGLLCLGAIAAFLVSAWRRAPTDTDKPRH